MFIHLVYTVKNTSTYAFFFSVPHSGDETSQYPTQRHEHTGIRAEGLFNVISKCFKYSFYGVRVLLHL